MEIKRKKISQDEIFEKEEALVASAKALEAEYNEKFSALGYELTVRIGQKENEAEPVYEERSEDADKSFDAGYISRALFVVRRRKTEEELSADEAMAEENRKAVEEAESEEEAEQLENDETLRVSEDALKRAVAYTECMLVRSYRAFWTDWLSICDSFDSVRDDLEEFLLAVRKKAEE